MQIQVEKALLAYNPIRMPSSWGDEKRVEAMELFAHDPERHVWVSGTRSVREAIDVSCADVTICCDLLWSPAWQCQAWSRTMAPTERDRDCEVYLMLSQNSLDEYIYTVFYSKMVGAEQALDRKVMNRRALDFDVKFFAQRVLEEEEALSLQIRDDFGDTEMVYMPELELAEERAS
jgi:ERCC4-related helicase